MYSITPCKYLIIVLDLHLYFLFITDHVKGQIEQHRMQLAMQGQ